MSEPNGQEPLDDLNKRLKDARNRKTAGTRGKNGAAPRSDYGPAIRVGTDLVAGVAVGVVIGWVLDRWLGTTPWLLLVFFLLGSAAGITNVMRTAMKIESDAKADRESKRNDVGKNEAP
ncbi:MAG: AtpZ/AtpI family protein [Alphaproteobacteria bacterium]|jgi:ATP synthase protein I|nr:AtpZ/AtpI family protein [Alphaproteobacteria bacterium]